MNRSKQFFAWLAVAFWTTNSLFACPETSCEERLDAEAPAASASSEPEPSEPASSEPASSKPALRVFSGFYGGLGFSSQNVVGGSFIGGRDVLSRANRDVVDLFLGWRKQFGNRFVIGVEAQVGVVDGDLTQTDTATGYDVEYENDSQVAFGLTVGRVLGSQQRWLLYAYAYETEREFDVTIRSGVFSFTQNDKQGMLRLGLGTEVTLGSPFRLRLSAGTTRSDFGGAITNIDADGKFEVGTGLVISL